jgi:UDP-3-O-[3-hydroxymyristoyl] glucosamine N-acyltransferase
MIGAGTSIWHHAQVRDGATVGENCIIGKGVYIDAAVPIGDNVKIQNYVSIYHGVSIADGVFVGPHVCFTNDLRPRAVNPDGELKSAEDWVVGKTIVQEGASLGANATIRCGITIGVWAMIGQVVWLPQTCLIMVWFGVIRPVYKVLFAPVELNCQKKSRLMVLF